jgi:SAM-dependent methyltransferase
VVAVEPVAGMRAVLAAGSPGVPAREGTAERIPLPDGAVDVVTVAQAFHWFRPAPALAEIHRVLRGGGRLGLMWNVMDRSVPWVDRAQGLLQRHRGTNPWYSGHAWRESFAASRLFGGLQHAAFRNVQRTDAAGLRARIASVSFVADLPPAAREALLDDVVRIAQAETVTAAGGIEVPYVTDVFWCRRRP